MLTNKKAANKGAREAAVVARVPPEIWDHIFDEVLGAREFAMTDLARLTRVCKHWNVCSTLSCEISKID